MACKIFNKENFVLIGSDIPYIKFQDLATAFQILKTVDIVLALLMIKVFGL